MFTAQRYHMFTAQRYHYRADQYSLKILQSRLLTTRAFCEFARACAPRDGAPRLAAKQKISTSQRLSTFTKPFAERLSKPQRRQPHRESVGKSTENTFENGCLAAMRSTLGAKSASMSVSRGCFTVSSTQPCVCVCVCVCVRGGQKDRCRNSVRVCVSYTVCGGTHTRTD